MDRLERREKQREMLQKGVKVSLLGVFVTFTIFVTTAAWNVYQKAEHTKENAQQINARLDELKTREAELAASVALLESEFGVEAEIRDKYGLTREGEEVVVIIDAEEESAGEDEDAEKKGFFKRIFDIF
jgi:cell division protein FtsB